MAALASCSGTAQQDNKKEDVLAAHTDTTVSPRDDFFAYAHGTWIKNNPIPADEVTYGIGELVEKELREKLLAINNDAVKKAAKSGNEQLIGDFWYSAMDTVNIEQQGIAPLRPILEAIAGIKTREDLLAQSMLLHTRGVGVFFSGHVAQDAKNSDAQAYYMEQGGLGLPNRDYYFNTNPRAAKILAQYPSYLKQMFGLMGSDPATAEKKAANVLRIETELAKASRKLEDLRDPYRNYNKYAIKDLKKLTPGIDWPVYLQKLGVQHVDSVIVGQPEFYKAVDKIVATTDMEALKDYMSFHLVNEYANYLSKPFVDANFDFYKKLIRGAQEQQARPKRALETEQTLIGEVLGQLFVKEYFSEKAKARYEQIVENVRNAYKARMEKLDWMSPDTKQRAIHKLMVMTKKVGYPDKWKDFSSLKIDRGPYAANVMRGAEWWYNYSMNKLGKPVDRTEWDMTPQTYNAYYNPSNNEIVLPAAMMTVPGYKDEELDDALVYGYMAASTVGHEITHGFDDEGRQFDEKGNLSAWWVPTDTTEFNKRANVLVQQFNKMVPIDTIHINGRATLGENLADLGGILIGLDAFKQTEAYKKGEKIAGYTPMQRYFLGYALGWQLVMRPEVLANQLLTDVHSPAKYRVNGPFPNVPEFYEAFNIQPGDKMYLADSLRVHLW
ncbi:M13 family metallopeptidase [Nemorincola caseinilytica]|uniref:M13 family metallopeptidase n=2 Tax=Nemorincola caseinilytica TaxID=2054315 RepID=A0ABP8NH41_9BACT